MRRFFTIIAFGLLASAAYGQGTAKRYIPPVDFKMYLSGNFGEIRDNHFHSGIDIKTQGVTGKIIRAVADGYVSRIAVSPTGYGNALYIHHPDGMTSVYGHLERFNDEIAEYVRDVQYKRESFPVDLYLSRWQFPVNQGEIIAYSGNSGSSAGPHLHFELREQATQNPVNVIAGGYLDGIEDTIPPRLVKLRRNLVMRESMQFLKKEYELVKEGGIYTLKDTSIDLFSNRHPSDSNDFDYYVLEVTDRKNGSDNTMGIYSITVEVDGKQVFGYRMDKLSFAESRYVNSFANYPLNRKNRNDVINLNIAPNNKLSAYTGGDGNIRLIRGEGEKDSMGITDNYLSVGDLHEVKISVKDDSGNESILEFKAATSLGLFYSLAAEPAHYVGLEIPFVYSDSLFTVKIPAGTAYWPFHMQIIRPLSPAEAKIPRPVLSQILKLGDESLTPLHTPMTVSIRPDSIPAGLRNKLCLASRNESGRIVYEGGTVRGDSIEVSTRTFGDYFVTIDTVPPTIAPAFAGNADLRGSDKMTIKISDDFSGISKWRITVDGSWALFDYDRKTNTLTHYFKYARYEKGKTHTLTATAEDARGNKTTVTRKFIY